MNNFALGEVNASQAMSSEGQGDFVHSEKTDTGGTEAGRNKHSLRRVTTQVLYNNKQDNSGLYISMICYFTW